MKYPPRLAHLATRPVLVAKIVPTYAAAHQLDEELAAERLQVALQGPFLEEVLQATWDALKQKAKGKQDAEVLERVASALSERPLRPGRTAKLTSGWSAFLLLADLHAGTASESVRKVLEGDVGRRQAALGLAEVGSYLAQELTRAR